MQLLALIESMLVSRTLPDLRAHPFIISDQKQGIFHSVFFLCLQLGKCLPPAIYAFCISITVMIAEKVRARHTENQVSLLEFPLDLQVQ